MDRDRLLRSTVLELLDGEQAHIDFDAAFADLSGKDRGARPPGSMHTPWRLLEHLRIAQWDIWRFTIDPSHVSPEHPAGYWPSGDAPPDPDAWNRSLEAFRSDRAALRALVADPAVDLLTPMPHGQGQTVLRGALLAADHNAYHLGQLIELRRAIGAWPEA